jgi:hypothetical protein
VEREEAAADFSLNLENPKESFEIYFVRDLTTGTAFDMEELHNQYELFTLDAATSNDRKQGPDEGKRMIPELEVFSRVTEYRETQVSDVGQQSTGASKTPSRMSFVLSCLGVLYCLALPCLVLSSLVLSCLGLVLSCLVLSCLVFPSLVLPCLPLSCLALPCVLCNTYFNKTKERICRMTTMINLKSRGYILDPS